MTSTQFSGFWTPSPLVHILARSITVNPRNLPYYVCFWANPPPPWCGRPLCMVPYCSVLLRTAEAEEISKRDFWKIKNEIAEREKNMADIKKKTLDAEHFTALINRNTAILNYNRVARAGNTITIPPLPNLELYAILPSEFTLGQIDMNQTRT